MIFSAATQINQFTRVESAPNPNATEATEFLLYTRHKATVCTINFFYKNIFRRMCLEQKYILLRLHCYLWKASKIWKEINIWQLADVSENTAVHRHQPCALLSLDRDSLYSTERKPGACFVIASHLGSSDVQSWTQSAPLPPQIKALLTHTHTQDADTWLPFADGLKPQPP